MAKYQVRGKSSSPATAAGNSTTATPSTAQNAGGPAPGVLLGISGGWLVAVAPWVFGGSLGFLLATIMRLLPVHWGALVFFSILGVGASFFVKEGSFRKWGRRAFGVVIILHILSAWVAPDAPKSVEGLQPGTSILTPSPAQEEQVAPPSPTPEVWDSTQFSDRGGIILDKPSQEIFIPLDSELCISELIDPDTGGNLLQRVTVGTDEYNTRMSQCWDISPGKISILVGHPEGAVIEDEYKRFGGKLPVIRPK